MRRSSWLGSLVAAAALVVGAGAGPTGASAAPDPDRVSSEQLRTGSAATAARAAGLLAGIPPAVALEPAAVTTAGYADTCHDADGSRLDLRELAVTDDVGAARFAVTLTSCTPWSGTDLGNDGYVEIPLAVPGGRGDGPDYSLVVTADSGGAMTLTVLRTPSDDPDTWSVTSESAVTRPDGYTASGALPHAAIGDPSEFVFVATSVDGSGRVDLLPEVYASVLAFPFSCSLEVSEAATVVVDPAQAERVTGLARARGASARAAGRSVVALHGASDATLAALRRTPGVRSAERAVVFRRSAAPDDPAYPQQWSLPAVQAPAAWDTRTGSGLTLAVVDDGVDGVRAELSGRVLAGHDTTTDQLVPLDPDSDLGGHGTAVAGLAAATTDNALQVAGLDWDADVLPYRVFDAAGCASDAAVAVALTAAADRGASVANLSLGGPAGSEGLRQAVVDATARGMLVVAASGNARGVDDRPSFPAAYDEVLAVGATTRSGALASYSSGGAHLDVVAPGGDGSGTPEGDLLVLGERDGLDAQAGTSFAAPLVAAATLLFRAEHPELNPAQVRSAVTRTAVDAGPAGQDPDFGAGRLDVAALLAAPVVAPRSTELACPPGSVPEDGFGDVPPESAHEASVDCVVWWQVSTGTATGYAPLPSVTRAQMATFLARLVERSGRALPSDPPDAFVDDEGSVHELRINQLAAVGVVSGRGGGLFAPGEPVNRGQMATFLVRGYEHRAGASLPSDADYFADDAGQVHERSINAAAAAGFTGGLADGGYGPDAPVRRDGMATFLARVLDRLVDDGFTTPPGG